MDTVTVTFLIAGTVTEETWTADRILVQHFRKGRKGRAKITLMRGGQHAESVTYRRAERIHRVRGTATGEDA